VSSSSIVALFDGAERSGEVWITWAGVESADTDAESAEDSELSEDISLLGVSMISREPNGLECCREHCRVKLQKPTRK
jgi:hypothetical protein